MAAKVFADLQAQVNLLASAGIDGISRLVDVILADAVQRGASDVHFEPTHRALEIRYRLDGVVQSLAVLRRELAPNVVARLKVLADLLTYRTDIPQEGSIRLATAQQGTDMRVSTFPTIHGEKAVVRLFDAAGQVLEVGQLGLGADVEQALLRMLRERMGAIFLTGPSGSGKTTTIYACLRHLVTVGGGGQHIVTIEDPVEQVLEGVSQAQARPGTDFDFARGLRSLLRQDPDIIMIGEVRDRETAAIAIEAALTGHLVFTTLHAGSACGVFSRLLDMGIEPYLLTSAVKAVLNQRLVRRLCQGCRLSAVGCRLSAEGQKPMADGRKPMADGGVSVSPSVEEKKAVARCEQCLGTGYRGRLLLAELLTLAGPLRQAILARADTTALETAAASEGTGRGTLWMAAAAAIASGTTTAAEIERVLGPRPGFFP